ASRDTDGRRFRNAAAMSEGASSPHARTPSKLMGVARDASSALGTGSRVSSVAHAAISRAGTTASTRRSIPKLKSLPPPPRDVKPKLCLDELHREMKIGPEMRQTRGSSMNKRAAAV